MQGKRNAPRLQRVVAEVLESRRFFNAGGLDTTFNKTGIDSIAFTGVTVIGNATAVQADGKIVEVGKASDGEYAIVRYDANGVEDSTFGPNGNGKILAHIGTPKTASKFDTAQAVLIQADGKIVVAGDGLATDGTQKMFIARYTTAGVLDKTFGTNGMVQLKNFDGSLTAQDQGAYAVTLQGAKIVVVGFEDQGFGDINDNVVMARLNTDGSLDNTFGGGDGETDFDAPGNLNEVGEAVAIDTNGTASTNADYGKIIIVGHQTAYLDGEDAISGGFENKANGYHGLILRYLADGVLDTSFNKTGYEVTTAGSTAKSVDARGVAIESGGKIVIAGTSGTSFVSTDHNFFLARFTSAGALDKTFGVGGSTTTNIGGDDYGTSMLVGGFGDQLIVGGTSGKNLALAAYNLNGNLFTSFGSSGIVSTKMNNTASNVQLAFSPNHTIVAAGGTGFNTARYFDIGPIVSVASTDATAGPTIIKHLGKITEIIPNNATFVVSRDENLNVASTVFFTVGGTANPPTSTNVKLKKENYTLDGMTVTSIGTKTTYSVVIAAGTTSTTVTLTPQNIPANNTTATFTIVPSVNYLPAQASSQTITILGTNPAPVVIADEADDTVRDGSSTNKNFGTQKTLLAQNSSTVGNTRQAYLKFDISSLATVNTVTLSLFGALSSTANTNLETDVYSVADSTWTETGLTYTNKPAAGTKIASATILNTTQQTYTFDITAYVKAQLAAGNKTISLVLINPVASSASFTFNSREAASNQPTLTVT